jgi:predicted glutamine amidotransferase
MGRFLMMENETGSAGQDALAGFAETAGNSRTPEGFRNADGYGLAWFEKDGWHRFRRPGPIWENMADLAGLGSARRVLAHARHASFAWEKNDVSFNQPFVSARLAFVFDGFVEGVRLSAYPPGRSGAEKLFNYLLTLLETKEPPEALEMLAGIVKRNSTRLWGLNIGLADGETFYCYSTGGLYPEHYRLHFHRGGRLRAVSSEPLAGLDFQPVPRGVLFAL